MAAATAPALSFRYARLDEYDVLSRFLHEHWANHHVYCRDKALFDWTFLTNNRWEREGEYCFAVAEKNGEVVGILGGIPFLFNDHGKTCPGVWIANYVVHPDHRRGTLALQLLGQFRKPPFQAVIASGINPATQTIYKVLRGEVLPYMPRHFAVLPGCGERMRNLLAIAYPDWSAGQAAGLAAAFELAALPAAPGAVGQALPEDWDAANWNHIAQETTGASRDHAFLDWRYRQHPTFEYRFVTVADGSRTGLAVWRLETIRRTVENAAATPVSEHGAVKSTVLPADRVDVDRIGRLVEFLPASRQNSDELFAAAVNDMAAADAMALDYYGFHGAARGWLEEAGFRLAGSHEDGEKLPSRFQPLDGKGGGILSAMFRPAEVASVAIEPGCEWYWTKADSDQDRPN
ncbi:MAG: GNAT family N-acetyltransferase [Bryobacteraceae bacterium]